MFVTAADGKFTIELTSAIPGQPAVVATKIGYRTRGVEFLELPSEDVLIELLFASPPDNETYAFHPPGKGEAGSSTAYCDHCHTTLVKQFLTSAHAKAAKDPFVQDLYAGVTEAANTAAECASKGGIWRPGITPGSADQTSLKCYIGGGVLPDLNPACGGSALACDDPALSVAEKPTAFGKCADCHAPGMKGKAGGRNLHDAVGIPFESGNHCDVCHKIRDVDLSQPAGVGGAAILQRPREKLSDMPGALPAQVMFGPLPDVPNEFMGGSYQPKFKTAELCAACHQYNQEPLLPGSGLDPARWPTGLPVLDTYGEWKASSFNNPGTPCQFCHMPPDDTGLVSSLDVTTADNASLVFGFVRPPEDLRKHIFRGPLEGSPRLINGALNLVLQTKVAGAQVEATVTVQNTLAGHAIPTGEPMRSLVLLVQAEGCGGAWPANAGATVHDGGGSYSAGTVGSDVTQNGTSLTWNSAAAVAKSNMRVRVVRPTGTFDDYSGVGFFADPTLTAEEKGLPLFEPVGEANIVGVAGPVLSLDAAIAMQPGDIIYLGDVAPMPPIDGAGTSAFAGASGYTFAKTLTDPDGNRHVHHYRGVDIVSDNRISPQSSATTTHQFGVPMGCTAGKVTATLLYRPVPLQMAQLRGWAAKDWVVGSAAENVSVP